MRRGWGTKLDDTDRRIVALLARHGRLTNRQLASRVDLSPSSCLERVRKLEASGVILGYRAITSLGSFQERFEGWGVVRFQNPSSHAMARFIQLIRDTPSVIEAHRIAGPYDYALRFLSGDRSAWSTFQQQTEAFGCPVETRFAVLLEALK